MDGRDSAFARLVGKFRKVRQSCRFIYEAYKAKTSMAFASARVLVVGLPTIMRKPWGKDVSII